MTPPEFERICASKPEAHAAASGAYATAQDLIADGKRVRIVATEAVDDISARQRRFLHGPVLSQISEQVRMPDGSRYVVAMWKEFYRLKFLEAVPVYEMIRLPGYKRAVPRRVRQSTEDLGVKAYSEYIDRVIADAQTEWSVEFDLDLSEREAVQWKPARKREAVAA